MMLRGHYPPVISRVDFWLHVKDSHSLSRQGRSCDDAVSSSLAPRKQRTLSMAPGRTVA